METIKLNAMEMAKVNGGNGIDSPINPDGSCSNTKCKCASDGSSAEYTANMNSADSAWGR